MRQQQGGDGKFQQAAGKTEEGAMISFLVGIAIGSVAGMLIMALFIAGKKEEDCRVSALSKQ